MTTDEEFMREALALADRSADEGEVPVGAVVVMSRAVVGRGSNSPIAHTDPTAHAEMLAIRQAAAQMGNYRLTGATLYYRRNGGSFSFVTIGFGMPAGPTMPNQRSLPASA